VRTARQKNKSGLPLAEIPTSEGAMLIRMSLTKVEGEGKARCDEGLATS
jgi:hypothetical protein